MKSSAKRIVVLLTMVFASLSAIAQNSVPPGFQPISALWKASPVTTDCSGFTDGFGQTWTAPLFDDSAWSTITPPDIGSFNTPGLNPSDRFYRGTFSLQSTTQPVFLFFVSDDGIEIFINGQPLTPQSSFSPQSTNVCHQLGCVNIPGCGLGFDLDPGAVQIPAALLQSGTNLIAAHVSNGGGGSYFDLAVLVPAQAAPKIFVNTSSVSFGRQVVGTVSVPHTVLITNAGGGVLIPSFDITGDYTQTNDCAGGLLSGGTCHVNVTFSPTDISSRDGTLLVTAAGVAASQEVSLDGFGSLRFPLKGLIANSDIGLSSLSAEINTVFDHSMENGLGQYQIYGCDKAVVDFSNEIGNREPSEHISGCKRGYSQFDRTPFFVNGNYSGGTILFYDGHPGYDFQSGFGNQVYAAAKGVIRYPTLHDLTANKITVGGDPDNFQVLELDIANDVKVFYLHLSTHPRAISFHLSQSLSDQDFVGVADNTFTTSLSGSGGPSLGSLSVSGTVQIGGQPEKGIAIQLLGRTLTGDCIDQITKTNSTGNYSFIGLAEGFYNLRAVKSGFSFSPAVQNPHLIPEGTVVSAGDFVGESGNAGGCFGPHLHFEVQRETNALISDHLSNGQTLALQFIPVDPYGWQPSVPETVDPYFQIPDLQNSGLANENLWEAPQIPVLVRMWVPEIEAFFRMQR